MKITETKRSPEGELVTNEFNIRLLTGIPKVCHLLIPEEEPFAVKIIQSGWRDTYHVIREWGDTGNSDYEMMSIKELLDRYPEFEDTMDEVFPAVAVSSREFLDYPNDKDLGNAIRKKSINSSTKTDTSGQLEIQF